MIMAKVDEWDGTIPHYERPLNCLLQGLRGAKELLQYLMAVLEKLQEKKGKEKEEATLVLKWVLINWDPCC